MGKAAEMPGETERAKVLQGYLEQTMRERGLSPPSEVSDADISQEVQEVANEIDAIWASIGDFGARAESAQLMIERLIPGHVDKKVWEKIALGENFKLPVSQQYGKIANRVLARGQAGASLKGNGYGRVHAKGNQTPSEFLKRQGKAVTNAAVRVRKLEEELEEAKEDQRALEAGLRTYAATCLLTAMRDVASPVFAVSPAWTLLRAISGRTGSEINEADAALETKRILIALHALREHDDFERELKTAIHAICIRYQGEIKRRGAACSEFDGLYDYAEILETLQWPEQPEESYDGQW